MRTTLVETTSGKVQGYEQGAITVWKGIPFAHPPIAHRRFLPPQPPQPWSGVHDATQFGSAALQSASPGNAAAVGGPSTSENCLSLNIWSPGTEGQKRPVMVAGLSLALLPNRSTMGPPSLRSTILWW